jgi:hypothetical protein
MRRRRPSPTSEVRRAARSFRQTIALVEEAKRGLAEAAPGGRSPGLPLANAVASFEEGIREARSSMEDWRVDEVREEWVACSEGLDEAARRAEDLRLRGSPDGYENLYGVLGDLMEPLGAFQAALDRFGRLGA